ncbi:MAG: hypothetical protein ACRDG6_06530 [Candidatus Limnocylindria bacterium]
MALSRSRAVALIVALALAFGSSAVLARTDARTSIATLTVVDGPVLIRHGGADFSPARQGDMVVTGATIRAGAGASAEITYFEGSSARIESDAEIVVVSLGARADGGPLIGIVQTIGRTWHVVTELVSGTTRYDVRTPTSTATVRG